MATTEADFLRAIAAQPGDRHLRLIYADWLDDHSDLRAEVVRIEEQMRSEPTWSDSFWSDQPQRDALIRDCSTIWLRQMGYLSPGERPIFAGVPDDPASRWRAIRAFLRSWYDLPLGDVGGSFDETWTLEETLDLEFPESLREWASLCQELLALREFDEVIRDRFEINVLDDHEAVSLLDPVEGTITWAIRLDDFEEADPPVVGMSQLRSRSGFDLAGASSLSEFALTYLLDNLELAVARGSISGGFTVANGVTQPMLAGLRRWFPHSSQIGPGHWILEGLDRIASAFDPLQRSDVPQIILAVRRPIPAHEAGSTLLEIWNRTSLSVGRIVDTS